MPGAAEPAMRRAQPGALDPKEVNPAVSRISSRKAHGSADVLFPRITLAWRWCVRLRTRSRGPLIPSLRTRGMAVEQACLSTDLGVRRQGSPVEVTGVAVLRCCTFQRSPLISSRPRLVGHTEIGRQVGA